MITRGSADRVVKAPIQSLEASYLVHATEDPEKIGGAVARLLALTSEAEAETLEGHYGNQIIRARFRLTGDEASKAFEALVAEMPGDLRNEIVANVGAFIDEHSALFVRLDKQQLVSGKVASGSGDSVRVKVKPRAFLMKGSGAQFYRNLLGLS